MLTAGSGDGLREGRKREPKKQHSGGEGGRVQGFQQAGLLLRQDTLSQRVEDGPEKKASCD